MNAPIRTLVVDDEPLARQGIRMLLADDAGIAVVGECDGAEALEVIERTQPELMFVDVQMPEVDGFDLIESIGIESAPVVVFVTAYSEYAQRAFDVHALDYLLKPVADARFARALERARVRVLQRREGAAPEPNLGALLRERSRTTRRILVPGRHTTRVLDVDTIDWIEAADYYALIHAGGESHLLRESLNQLEQRLDPGTFQRVHRSAIVNVGRVREIHGLLRGDRDLVLADGTHVRLSRTRREAFEQALGAERRARRDG